MRTAILDIGSNSTLLLIGARTPTGWQVLTDQTRITRLGEGFEPAKQLQPAGVERTLQAVEAYLQECQSWGASQVLGLATAVVREATNPELLIEPLATRWQFQIVREGFAAAVAALSRASRVVCVLSEQEEAQLSFVSVAKDESLELTDAPIAVVDIGGGSVEVAYGRTVPEQAFSFPIGARRVRETLMPSNSPEPREILQAVRALDETLMPLRSVPQPERVVAIGGTGVNLAVLALGLSAFDPTRTHGIWLTDEVLGALLNQLLRLNDAERSTLPGIEPERAPLLHIGALILERVLYALRREAVQISVRGIRYSALWSL